MGLISNLFKKKKPLTFKERLSQLYAHKGYKHIPELPGENEARAILENYEAFPNTLVYREYMSETYENNLLRGEIVLLWWLGNARTKKSKPPKYFLYDYGINFDKSLSKLFNLGYVDENNKINDEGKKLLSKYRSIVKQHRMKKSVDSDGNITYLESSILNGEEKKKALRKEFVAQINEALCSMRKSKVEQYEIIADSENPEITQLNGKIFNVSDAKIGLNAPPFEDGDRSSIAPYIDRAAYEKSLKERGL